MLLSVEPSMVAGRVRAPSSKSAMQRAIACATMASGVSTLHNPSWCNDSIAAIAVASALGARIERLSDRLIIDGGRLCERTEPISVSCGESGLALRMFSAIASLLSVPVELQAEGSLRYRPVGMIANPLESLGVSCHSASGLPPVSVCGPLRAGNATVDGSESSQFLTGLLLALPMARPALVGEGSRLSITRLASRGYIDLSLDVMRAFGAEVERDASYSEFTIGCKPYEARQYEVEGDWSGAAFLLVAGAIAASGSGLLVEGLSAQSSQPDRAIIDALMMAGADVGSPPGAYRVKAGPLHGFSFDASDCPDLFPPLVALASRCDGITRLLGADRLRTKESDRARALSEEFAALGLKVIVDGNEMIIEGRTDRPSGRLSGGTVSARGDHRIAMAAAVAALAADGAVHIEGAESVAKSWPGFFDDLASICS
ncbi:MAG: 3-phosphoshikimate 1-carboxyvinyltransferase [Spirochaetia bacterium]|nr:3-phosphoshikimate 1-carboxyvinyltransferase [Spirochaetia bacterium]